MVRQFADPKKSASSFAIIGDISSRLSYQQLAAITDKLAKTTRIEREPGRWPMLEPEVDLAGNADLSLRWLKFALEVNYGDFFAAGGLLEGAINPGAANTRVIPPDIPWVIHRIVTSRSYRASLIEVQRHWSIDDVADAHQALDYFAYLERLQMRAEERK